MIRFFFLQKHKKNRENRWKSSFSSLNIVKSHHLVRTGIQIGGPQQVREFIRKNSSWMQQICHMIYSSWMVSSLKALEALDDFGPRSSGK